ncbi:LolA-related protein [Ideonella sp. BN130291]|uniref:LolA-related protein n=1 Tax=Ideonella sp. BN130291 TaxID=3112940 RepID=UPI002E25C012|nr:LolA-related protein [Ideonella sp. BN130291]
MRAELRSLVCGLLLAAIALPALALELPELMALLARRTSGQATFSEQRFVKGLDEPLVSTGTLSFAAPDRFARRTLQPRAESMVVEGNTVTLSRGGRSRTLALDSSPEAVIAVEAVRGTLTGNAQALQRHFRTRLSGDAERWTLELQPVDPRTAGALRSVRILGQQSDLRVVETQLLDGDRTVMTIDPVRGPAAAASAP